MKASITSIEEARRSEMYSSGISSRSNQFGGSNGNGGELLGKNPSQTSFHSSTNLGSQFKVTNRNLEDIRNMDYFRKKSVNNGKENTGDTKFTDIMTKPIVSLETQTTILTSNINEIKKAQEVRRETSPIPKSKPKDPKIQQLIDSNAPKMTRDKEYYIEKLIECQNALRVKDKKLKVLEKNQREYGENLDKAQAAELMYKTQLQALQKYQKGQIHSEEDLKQRVVQLESSLVSKEVEWKQTNSVLLAQVLGLKQQIQEQELVTKNKDQTILSSENALTASVNEYKSLYSQAKVENTELEAKNILLSRKVQELTKESHSLRTTLQQNEFTSVSTVTALQTQNQQLQQTLSDTQLEIKTSQKTISSLKIKLKSYQEQSQEQKTTESASIVELKLQNQDLLDKIQELEQNEKVKGDKIFELQEAIDKYKSLAQFTQNQTKELESVAQGFERQEVTIQELTQTNQDLVSTITKLKTEAGVLEKIYEQLSVIEERSVSETVSVEELIQVFGSRYTFWNSLGKTKNESGSPETTFWAEIRNIIGIEESQQWQNILLKTITALVNQSKQLKDLQQKFKEKTKFFQTRLHVAKEEDQRKTLVISDLKGNIKLTEKSLNEASDKLMKCTTLLEQSNQKIFVAEARLADAKNQLSAMYGQLKAENEAIALRNQSVELQLRDLLMKHYEGFYDNIVERAPEDLLRMDVFLIKAFLSTTIEINHKIKQVVPTSAYMQELLAERDATLVEIRQYYKQILQPEIAQVMAYYKPVGRKA